MKFVPGRVRMLNCPPLKPPRETSYGAVTRELETAASRGRFEPPKFAPFRVVLFWSWPSPSTEKPEGSPSAPGIRVTPGSDAAIAARSPIWAAVRPEVLMVFSVPPTSAGLSPRATFSRGAVTLTASRVDACTCNLASATKMS